MIVAPPPPFTPVALPPSTVTEPVADELQVSGALSRVVPDESTTVGVISFAPLEEPLTVRLIDCTRQVVKLNGTLVLFPMMANKGVTPGTWAVTSTWFSDCPFTTFTNPLAVVLVLATPALSICQVNCPTLGVMSTPRA